MGRETKDSNRIESAKNAISGKTTSYVDREAAKDVYRSERRNDFVTEHQIRNEIRDMDPWRHK